MTQDQEALDRLEALRQQRAENNISPTPQLRGSAKALDNATGQLADLPRQLGNIPGKVAEGFQPITRPLTQFGLSAVSRISSVNSMADLGKMGIDAVRYMTTGGEDEEISNPHLRAVEDALQGYNPTQEISVLPKEKSLSEVLPDTFELPNWMVQEQMVGEQAKGIIKQRDKKAAEYKAEGEEAARRIQEQSAQRRFNEDNLFNKEGDELRGRLQEECALAMGNCNALLSRDLNDISTREILDRDIRTVEEARQTVVDLLGFDPEGIEALEEATRIIDRLSLEILSSSEAYRSQDKESKRSFIVKRVSSFVDYLEQRNSAQPSTPAKAEQIEILENAKKRARDLPKEEKSRIKRNVTTEVGESISRVEYQLDSVFRMDASGASVQDSYAIASRKARSIADMLSVLNEAYKEEGNSMDVTRLYARLRREGVFKAGTSLEDAMVGIESKIKRLTKTALDRANDYINISSPHLKFQHSMTDIFQRTVGKGYETFEDVQRTVQDVLRNPGEYTNQEAVAILGTYNTVYEQFKDSLDSGLKGDAVAEKLYNMNRVMTGTERGVAVSSTSFVLYRGEENASLTVLGGGDPRVVQASQNEINVRTTQAMQEYKKLRGITELSPEESDSVKQALMMAFQVDPEDGLINFNAKYLETHPVLMTALMGSFLKTMNDKDTSGTPRVIIQLAKNSKDNLLQLNDPKVMELLRTANSEEANKKRREIMTSLATMLSLTDVPAQNRDTLMQGLQFSEGDFRRFSMLRAALEEVHTDSEGFLGNAANALTNHDNPQNMARFLDAMQGTFGLILRGTIRSLTVDPMDSRSSLKDMTDLFERVGRLRLDNIDDPTTQNKNITRGEAAYDSLALKFTLPPRTEKDKVKQTRDKLFERVGVTSDVLGLGDTKIDAHDEIVMLLSLATKQVGFSGTAAAFVDGYNRGGEEGGIRPAPMTLGTLFTLDSFVGREPIQIFNNEVIGVNKRHKMSAFEYAGGLSDDETVDRFQKTMDASLVNFTYVSDNLSLNSPDLTVARYAQNLRDQLGLSEEAYQEKLAKAIRAVQAEYKLLADDTELLGRDSFKRMGRRPNHTDVLFNVIRRMVPESKKDFQFMGLTRSVLNGRNRTGNFVFYPTEINPNLTPHTSGKAGGMDTVRHVDPDGRPRVIKIPLILYYEARPYSYKSMLPPEPPTQTYITGLEPGGPGYIYGAGVQDATPPRPRDGQPTRQN